MSKEHTYTNGELTIVWKQDLCIHSKNCWKSLGDVFKPGERPWIHPEGATTERIKAQIDKCPSGALSYRMAEGAADVTPTESDRPMVEVSPDGPLMIKGSIQVKHSDGRIEEREKVTALCRCGSSSNKPFCDGSHRTNGFVG
ncbi:MAG: (4Fe-4S)-binding protein [Flavobacteriales bacterium]